MKPLTTPVKDAARLVELLLDRYTFERPEHPPAALDGMPGVIPYNTTEVKCLYNDRATRREIGEHLKALSKVVTADDHLLIYFAGHGDNIPGVDVGNIMPYEADVSFADTWYGFNDLFQRFGNYIGQQKIRNLLLILDCCCGGAVLGGASVSHPTMHYSRYAATAAANLELAMDAAFDGSPFTSVLCNLLTRNTAPEFYLNEKELRTEVKHLIERWANENGVAGFTQTPQYRPLNECGKSEFAFRRKYPDVPPVEVLTEIFIKHLNFETQKEELRRQYRKGNRKDLIVITTICDNLNVQRMQGKVLLEKLKMAMYFNFRDFVQISVEPDKLDNDIWKTLAANTGLQQDGNLKRLCAQHICGRLLRTATGPHRPLLLYLGCSFQSAERSREMIAFCRQLQEELEQAKSEVQGNIAFNSLIVIIADTRAGTEKFFKPEDFLESLGTDRHVIVASAVEELEENLVSEWHELMCGTIHTENFRMLDISQYFITGTCRIEDFVHGVSDKLGINRDELASKLWH
ncbi:caspase family protein [Chitinophaga caseinilytica]|uniref:Caspase family protein n=1 Tax=Chitinophaga caseinilytica TaxID=2267521 RepID=A0ABZ2Z3K8_9BACT